MTYYRKARFGPALVDIVNATAAGGYLVFGSPPSPFGAAGFSLTACCLQEGSLKTVGASEFQSIYQGPSTHDPSIFNNLDVTPAFSPGCPDSP
jgi:hypothetical protein